MFHLFNANRTPTPINKEHRSIRVLLEFIQHFEQIAARFRPAVLIAPGLAAVLLGLFIWLSGLRFRRFISVVIGAVIGGVCGFFAAGRNVTAALVSAGVGAGLGVIFKKIFIIILTAAIVMFAGFVVLNRQAIDNADSLKQFPNYQPPENNEPFDIRRAIEIMTEYAAAPGDALRGVGSQMSLQNWAIIAVIGAASIVAGFFLWRIISAFCCAVIGTTFIFAGMALLLLYKGSEPLSRIYNGPSFYAAVFAAMTGFGTIEQLLLFRLPLKKAKADSRPGRQKQESESPERTNWRSG